MGSIQGTPGPQPTGPAEGSRPPQADQAQQKEAEKDSHAFDQALHQHKDDRKKPDQLFDKELHHGRHGQERQDGKQLKGEQKEALEDLFRQAHSRKPEGKEREEADMSALADAAKTLEARMGKAAEVHSVDNRAMIDKIDKIADRIMVSNAADVKQIKVDFKDGILPGTEATIRRDGAGKLQIEFATTSADSFHFLSKGEQALVETLNRKLGGDIAVEIKMQGHGADQDTGDGRSRQQYQADEDGQDREDNN